MKTLLLSIFAVLLLSSSAISQVVVNDPQANLKLTQQTLMQNIQKGYQALSNKIQNSSLVQNVKTAVGVEGQLNLFQAALDVADQFQQLQSTKDFFKDHRDMIRQIREISVNLNSVRGFMRPAYQEIVRKNMDDAYILCAKSISVASTSFVRKQINLAERMAFLKEAHGYLEMAFEHISQCIRIVNEAKHYHDNVEKAKNFYKAIL